VVDPQRDIDRVLGLADAVDDEFDNAAAAGLPVVTDA
jgi:hypothetical protein